MAGEGAQIALGRDPFRRRAELARVMTAAGVTVVEVDRPDRKTRRMRGKSDPIDALRYE